MKTVVVVVQRFQNYITEEFGIEVPDDFDESRTDLIEEAIVFADQDDLTCNVVSSGLLDNKETNVSRCWYREDYDHDMTEKSWIFGS